MPFSPETLKFLTTNKAMNSKEWYHEHKSDMIGYVQLPFAELINDVLPVIQEHDPYVDCDPRIGKGISRLYRDTRFSYDKSLFRASAWCLFMHEKKLYNGIPAFYFEVTPMGFAYGCGYYWMEKDLINRVREMICDDSPEWQAAIKAYKSQSVFTLEGEKYKRTRHPQLSEDARDWADRKSLGVISFNTDLNALYSPDLGKRVAEDFKKIFPVYDFFFEAEMSKEVAKLDRNEYWR